MLTEEEKKFVAYWQANRKNEKKWTRQLRAGLPVGLSLSAAILLCLFSGWYKIAMMEVNTELSPWILMLAVVLITVSFGILYKKQKWEQNEQFYDELMARQKKEEGRSASIPIEEQP